MGDRSLITPPPGNFSRADFRAWEEQQPRGRFELHDGEIVCMAPERAAHAAVKANVWAALTDAIEKAGVPCIAMTDGLTVEIGESTDYNPDALVHCGDALSRAAMVASNPVIVVEVQSPSTARFDKTDKMAGYFTVGSIQHYLIVSAERPFVLHHRRVEGGVFTKFVYDGDISLDPPGITVAIADFYASWRRLAR